MSFACVCFHMLITGLTFRLVLEQDDILVRVWCCEKSKGICDSSFSTACYISKPCTDQHIPAAVRQSHIHKHKHLPDFGPMSCEHKGTDKNTANNNSETNLDQNNGNMKLKTGGTNACTQYRFNELITHQFLYSKRESLYSSKSTLRCTFHQIHFQPLTTLSCLFVQKISIFCT